MRRRAGGEGADELVGGSHCAGAGALWRGGATGQLRGGRLRAGPSLERRDWRAASEEAAQREAGSGGAT